MYETIFSLQFVSNYLIFSTHLSVSGSQEQTIQFYITNKPRGRHSWCWCSTRCVGCILNPAETLNQGSSSISSSAYFFPGSRSNWLRTVYIYLCAIRLPISRWEQLHLSYRMDWQLCKWRPCGTELDLSLHFKLSGLNKQTNEQTKTKNTYLGRMDGIMAFVWSVWLNISPILTRKLCRLADFASLEIVARVCNFTESSFRCDLTFLILTDTS